MRRNRKENMWNKVQRFSIRKFSFGVTSALVGTFFLANASMVHAETGTSETSAVEVSNGKSLTAEKTEETNTESTTTENAEVEKNTLPSAVKPEEKLSSERITEDKKVDKNELTKLVSEFSALLENVNREKVTKTSLSTTLLKKFYKMNQLLKQM